MIYCTDLYSIYIYILYIVHIRGRRLLLPPLFLLGGLMIRVTELLRRYGVAPEFPNVPAVRAAANRGTAVHELSLRIGDLRSGRA